MVLNNVIQKPILCFISGVYMYWLEILDPM